MKKVIWLLAFALVLAYSPTAFAQKMRYEKKDKTIYLDEKPHAKLYPIGGFMGADFSLKTLEEKEIVYFKYNKNKGFYEVIFMETSERAYLEDGTFLGAKSIAQFVVDHHLVKDNALNEEGKKRYITLFGTEPEPANNVARTINNIGLDIGNNNNGNNQNNNNQNNNVPAFEQYGLVERNKQGYIDTNIPNKIQQDFKIIGTFEKKEDFVNTLVTYYIKLPNGTAIAQAVGKGIAPQQFEVTAYANRSRSIITVRFATSPVEDIARYLVDNGYL